MEEIKAYFKEWFTDMGEDFCPKRACDALEDGELLGATSWTQEDIEDAHAFYKAQI